jgi:Xaa-Pro aminopeptidase
MTREEHRARRDRIAAQLAGREVEALVVSSLDNVRYLTGFTGSNAILILTPDTAVLFTDGRYTLQVSGETDVQAVIGRKSAWVDAARWLKRKRIRKAGFEAAATTHAAFRSVSRLVEDRVALEPVDGLVEAARMVKSAREVAAIRRSVEINSAAYAGAVARFRHGMTEQELAAELDYQSRLGGASAPAFETIVAAGPRSALPHARPAARPIGSNELLLIDMGALVEGYSSDMTRVLHVGRPSKKARELYAAVREAQEAAVAAIRPGVTAGSVDRVARETLEAHGFGEAFVHSTGHGLGLNVHEPPRLGKGEKTRLEAGMTVTVEPGAYLAGFGGVRIEDTVLVTAAGSEVLTPTGRGFNVI